MTAPACRGVDTEIFYDAYRWADAAKLCNACPVKLQCRQEFVDDPYAYAGGMTPGQRRAWRRAPAAPKPKPEPKAPLDGREKTRGRPLTGAKVSEILGIWDSELIGAKLLADRVSVSKSAVQRVLRENGRERSAEERALLAARGSLRNGQVDRGERNREMIKKLHAEGYAPKEIAEMSGITRAHVYKVQRELGLSRKGSRTPEIIELTKQGLPARDIATRLHVSRSLVHQVRTNMRRKGLIP